MGLNLVKWENKQVKPNLVQPNSVKPSKTSKFTSQTRDQSPVKPDKTR